MTRLVIELPCASLGERTLSIIDTPGLDSSLVWRQLEEEVRAKAFVMVWVGSLVSPAAFGLQGRHLLSLYRKTGQMLPPVLVLTKWDKLRADSDFPTAHARAKQAQHRVAELCAGLYPTEARPSEHVVTCVHPGELQCIKQDLSLDETTGKVTLARSLLVGSQVVLQGSELIGVLRGEQEILSPDSTVTPELLDSSPPLFLRFRLDHVKMPVLLAATDARAYLEQRDTGERIRQLWASLLELLQGLSDPMHIGKTLGVVMAGMQSAMNILLKDDRAANIFEQNQEEYEASQREVVCTFQNRVQEYFADFPLFITRDRYKSINPSASDAHCNTVMTLDRYRPPPGLSSDECATSLLNRFVLEIHEEVQNKKYRDYFKYIKEVAEGAIGMWREQYICNMHRYEEQCTARLLQNKFPVVPRPHRRWSRDTGDLVEDTIVATVTGSYCAFLAGAVMTSSGAVAIALPVALAVGVGTSATILSCSDVGKKLGSWTYEEARNDALQTCLDQLSIPEFQAQVKQATIADFAERLEQAMRQFASFRDIDSSDGREARTARSIRQEVEEIRFRLERWFSHFLSSRLAEKNAWIVEPPQDFREALDADLSVAPDPQASDATFDPPARTRMQRTVAQKAALITAELGLDVSQTLKARVDAANLACGLQAEGSLGEQLDRLILELAL
eukprot:gnl/TRDRNA2_/TRDRNA2_133993_c1_seq1.p1 gnl/TRDRNA2_/TRDRNA2_133993_c1~~gnl/TRDRNA2_/TRDRNA2_133993_c1_seq1.p1  ORF type:complete len:778 (+),score=143.47 gnl/TRDRNA2_/TRDRNA2_133993_c1_seq1:310-2334(+)